jgi:hypothetical protein
LERKWAGDRFGACGELLELVKDKVWLAKVTNATNGHWRKQNAAKKDFTAGSQSLRVCG